MFIIRGKTKKKQTWNMLFFYKAINTCNCNLLLISFLNYFNIYFWFSITTHEKQKKKKKKEKEKKNYVGYKCCLSSLLYSLPHTVLSLYHFITSAGHVTICTAVMNAVLTVMTYTAFCNRICEYVRNVNTHTLDMYYCMTFILFCNNFSFILLVNFQ